MTKAYGIMTVKSFTESDDKRTITGLASTPKPDRDNDIVEAKGAKFALPIPLLWQHNHNSPIGHVTEARVTEKGVEFTATIAKIEEEGALKNRIDEAWQSIKSGLVKCVSVGFRPLEYEFLKSNKGLHIKSWEWYELSVVTVGANPDAVITSVKQIKKAFNDAEAEPVMPNPDTHKKTSIEPENQNPVASVAGDTPSHVALVDPNAGSIPLIME